MKKIIIIGGSHAGVHAAFTLRNQMPDAKIDIFSDESYYPYHRPPLSKKSLQEESCLDDILLKPKALYIKNNITFHTDSPVTNIDSQNSVIHAQNQNFEYDKLIIATGGTPRPLEIDGVANQDILYIRNFDDAQKLKNKLLNAHSVLIIGGGYIGLETAASLRVKGKDVTVIEAANRILNRVLCPIMSDYYQSYHESKGVNFIINDQILNAKKQTSGYQLKTKKGEMISANIIIVGIGIVPTIKLAEEIGINCSNGIEVNQYCQTNIDNIYAIGDCSNYYHERYGQALRIESVQNATEQARLCSSHICGNPFKEPVVPWFWSDQYDLNLKMVGLNIGYEEIIIRGDINNHKFTCFYIAENKVVAADAVNSPGEFMAAKIIITKNKKVDLNILKDQSLSISEVMKLWQS